MSIVALFCKIDNFFLSDETGIATPWLPKTTPVERRGLPRSLHPSEVMTILIMLTL